jgi:chromate reductase
VFLDTKLMGQPEVYFNALTGFDENGELASSAEGFIKAFAEAFVKHVESSSAAK